MAIARRHILNRGRDSAFLSCAQPQELRIHHAQKPSLTYFHPGRGGQLVPPAGADFVIRKPRKMVGQYSFARLPTAVSPNRMPYR